MPILVQKAWALSNYIYCIECQKKVIRQTHTVVYDLDKNNIFQEEDSITKHT